MTDQILRALVADGKAVLWLACTTQIAKQAQDLHKLTPLATCAMGRVLTGSALMAAGFKGEQDEITVIVKGDGPIGKMLVVADAKGNVRGCVDHPSVNLPDLLQGKPDVAGAVGRNGYLTVIRDLGLKKPYIGHVALQSGEIGEDLAYYYSVSMQIPSVVFLSTRVNVQTQEISSGGLLLQTLPDCDSETMTLLENRLPDILQIGSFLEEGLSLEDIAKIVFIGMDVQILEKRDIQYTCPCSKERLIKSLLCLGEKELTDILHEQGSAEVCCQFCNKVYHFPEAELHQLIEEIRSCKSKNGKIG